MKRIGQFLNKLVMVPSVIKTFKNWPMVFLLRFLRLFTLDLFNIGPHMVCTMRNGVKFKVGTNPKGHDSTGMILNIWLEKYHELSRKNITINNIVIDIGADIGIFSVLAATLANNVTVYAYEPVPERFSLLQDNIKINGLEKHIMPFNYAVAGKKGERKLHITNLMIGPSFFCSTDNYINVKCLTLEDIFQSNKIERCDFLKIDCEGAEYEILFNTPEECLNKARKIHLEYHESPGINYNRHDLMNFLVNAGFEVTLKPWEPALGLIYAEKVPSAPQNHIQGISF